jgi:hypothetical protein
MKDGAFRDLLKMIRSEDCVAPPSQFKAHTIELSFETSCNEKLQKDMEENGVLFGNQKKEDDPPLFPVASLSVDGSTTQVRLAAEPRLKLPYDDHS